MKGGGEGGLIKYVITLKRWGGLNVEAVQVHVTRSVCFLIALEKGQLSGTREMVVEYVDVTSLSPKCLLPAGRWRGGGDLEASRR